MVDIGRDDLFGFKDTVGDKKGTVVEDEVGWIMGAEVGINVPIGDSVGVRDMVGDKEVGEVEVGTTV